MTNSIVRALAVSNDPIFEFTRRFLAQHGFDIRSKGEGAREWCRRQAENEDVEAQVALAEILTIGLFGPEDHDEALLWWQRAAAQGDPAGLTMLAGLTESGYGDLPANPARAFRLLEMAASAGYAPAMNSLAVMYLQGINVGEDYSVALQYLRQAAGLGDAYAQCLLGVQLTKEVDPSKVEEGVKLIKAAAEQNYPPAHRHIGYFYMGGSHGFPEDKEKSNYHLNLAANLEDESQAGFD